MSTTLIVKVMWDVLVVLADIVLALWLWTLLTDRD